MGEVTYNASKTARKFHNSDKFVRLLFGPIGSGKSVACIMEMIRISTLQEPHNNVRKTRWCVVRNTYRELLDTTMKSFFDWVDKDIGEYSAMNTTFTMRVKLGDGTIMDAEFLFRALDKPKDVKKLLSLELTGIFLNECREIPKQILDMGQGRVGRYPSKRDGGPTWFGLIADTNPPDSDSWIYKLFEETRPDNHAIFHQPSGLEEDAENVENLPPNYYTNMMQGKVEEWINVYCKGLYGYISDGKPVYPEYFDNHHFSDTPYTPAHGTPIFVGIDFGLTPAACFGQITVSGQFVVFDELVTFDMGAVNFGKLLKQKMSHDYPGHNFEIYGDPAGDQRAQTDEVTPFQILNNQGISAVPTFTNDPIVRREVVVDYLQRFDFAGEPAFRLTPGAKMLRKGFNGGYHYRRMQVTGEEKFVDKPDKGKFSHVSDACQYMFLGAVGDTAVVGGYGENTHLDYSQTNQLVI